MIETIALPLQLQKQYASKQGYVYLVNAAGTNLYKIGRSKNPVARLERLKTQSPYPLQILKCFWTPDALSDEKKMHAHFGQTRVYGEWFGFDDLRYYEEFDSLKFTALEIAERAYSVTISRVLAGVNRYGISLCDDFKNKILVAVRKSLIGCCDIDQMSGTCAYLESFLVPDISKTIELVTDTPTEQEIKIVVLSAITTLSTVARGIA